MVVAGIRIVGGTVAAKKASRESKPSLESMNEVSWSSGPTCLSAKVSRESKREEGAFAVARHRAVCRGTAERRASLRADAERRAAMGGMERKGREQSRGKI